MTPEQQEIYQFVSEKGGTATRREIVSDLKRCYYVNGEKHVSDRLSRMVKAGFLKRDKPGVYSLGVGKKHRPVPVDANQTSLFNG